MISENDIISVGRANYRTFRQIFADPISLDFRWDDVKRLLKALGVSVMDRAETKILKHPDPACPEGDPLTTTVQLLSSQQKIHQGQARAIRSYLITLTFTPRRIKP
jgi:hypothetical protein